EHGVV
ncbi:hypothetical protein VCHENC02_3662B, partial [Vibrio harveyi]